jgi:hypothetical protein
MLNVKRKLWSGTILIQQDNLPELYQGEEISLDIFHEEASKHNRENFDWASSKYYIFYIEYLVFVVVVRFRDCVQVLEVSQVVSEKQDTRG